MVNGQLYHKMERANALTACAHNLHHAIAFLRAVRQLSAHYEFGLDIPAEQTFLDALARCHALHQQPPEDHR